MENMNRFQLAADHECMFVECGRILPSSTIVKCDTCGRHVLIKDDRVTNRSMRFRIQQAILEGLIKLGDSCSTCNGSGVVDSGGQTPWGSFVDIPCPECKGEQLQDLYRTSPVRSSDEQAVV